MSHFCPVLWGRPIAAYVRTACLVRMTLLRIIQVINVCLRHTTFKRPCVTATHCGGPGHSSPEGAVADHASGRLAETAADVE